MSHFDLHFATILGVLSLPSDQRSETQIEQLADLTKGIKFFTGLSKPVHEACCRVMKLAEYQKGDVVFRYGDVPDSFRIVLRGLVSVSIPTWTTLVAANALHQSAPFLSPVLRFSQALLHPNVKQRRKSHRHPTGCPKQPEPSVMVLNEVTTLGAGTSFGELGLLRGDKRAATITCKEKTTVAVLEKTEFDTILKEYQEQLLNNKITFLLSVPAFSNWNLTTMSKASYYFFERTYWKGDVVYREGDCANEVFVVKEGEFKVKRTQFTKTVVLDPELKSSYFQSLQITPMRTRPQIQLILKSTKEVFGDAEVLEDRPRDSTCVCVSKTGQVYATSKVVWEM